MDLLYEQPKIVNSTFIHHCPCWRTPPAWHELLCVPRKCGLRPLASAAPAVSLPFHSGHCPYPALPFGVRKMSEIINKLTSVIQVPDFWAKNLVVNSMQNEASGITGNLVSLHHSQIDTDNTEIG